MSIQFVAVSCAPLTISVALACHINLHNRLRAPTFLWLRYRETPLLRSFLRTIVVLAYYPLMKKFERDFDCGIRPICLMR